jgi:hypothetical protein
MKNILPVLAAISCMALPAPALTLEDFAPAALAGKTLTFAIESGTAPLATTGSWTGTFETSPANGFTIKNLSGNTVDASATRSYNGPDFPESHSYIIASFIAGQAAAKLTLWISEGNPRFYVDIEGNGQYGDVSIAAPSAPEIAVQQPAASNLTDGTAKKRFGTVKVGKKSATKIFTIKNTGTAPLTGLVIKKSGSNKGDFVIGPLGKSSLAPGAKTSFAISFKPRAKGPRSAAIAIASNDADENPFNIGLSGRGASK